MSVFAPIDRVTVADAERAYERARAMRDATAGALLSALGQLKAATWLDDQDRADAIREQRAHTPRRELTQRQAALDAALLAYSDAERAIRTTRDVLDQAISAAAQSAATSRHAAPPAADAELERPIDLTELLPMLDQGEQPSDAPIYPDH